MEGSSAPSFTTPRNESSYSQQVNNQYHADPGPQSISDVYRRPVSLIQYQPLLTTTDGESNLTRQPSLIDMAGDRAKSYAAPAVDFGNPNPKPDAMTQDVDKRKTLEDLADAHKHISVIGTVNGYMAGPSRSQLGVFYDSQLQEQGSSTNFGSQLTSSFFHGNSVEQHDNFHRQSQVLFEMPSLDHESLNTIGSHETHQDLNKNVGLKSDPDDNFNYSQQKAAKLGHEESQIQSTVNDHLGNVNVVIDALDSGIEEAAAEGGGSDGSFSNALIAEMEDDIDIYHIQIIRSDHLEYLREIGSGTFGTVYHGSWRGSDVAIKIIKENIFSGKPSDQERLVGEAHMLENLNHPNVVAFYGVVQDGGTLATVTEFMAHGSLRNVLIKKGRSLDRRRKLIIAMDAAFGMEYLHLKNIVHFDLKCDNLLVNMRDPQRPICKVGDFGLSKIKRKAVVLGGMRGTLPWMAPELLNANSTSRVSEKVDVFSFGITMWEILACEEPYANMSSGEIIGGVVKDTLRPTIPEHCDPEWRKMMEQCWAADPTIRPSFTEITKRLQIMSKGTKPNMAQRRS